MLSKNRIWKLQRPLFASPVAEPPMVMAYTENKVQLAMIPMPAEMIDEIFGDEVKIYALATVKNGVLKVKRLVPEQDW